VQNANGDRGAAVVGAVAAPLTPPANVVEGSVPKMDKFFHDLCIKRQNKPK